MGETRYAIHADDWPDFVQLLTAFRQGRLDRPAAEPPKNATAAATSQLLVLLDQLKPGETARALPLRHVQGDWYDVALIGWIDEQAFAGSPPTFALTLKDPSNTTPDIRSNPIPYNASADEMAEILRASDDPWPSHLVEVRLGRVYDVHLFRWKICVKPHPHARIGDRLITSGLDAEDNAAKDIRAVCQRHPWIESGEIRTVSAALPMAEPAALRPGTIVGARIYGNGGLCVTEAEIRAIHDANEGIFPYYDY
jgi:hypothetical protein